MAPVRPHTKTYNDVARARLGLAVTRAREAAGHPWRPSFAEQVGISVASLFKLESGRPVGPTVYEAVARALPDWTEDTPRVVLEGGDPPKAAAGAEPSRYPAELKRSEWTLFDKLRRNHDEHVVMDVILALREDSSERPESGRANRVS